MDAMLKWIIGLTAVAAVVVVVLVVLDQGDVPSPSYPSD